MTRPQSASIHAALLEAGAGLFYERGVACTGVDTLARAAGVGKPALYRHFGSKAGLLDSVLAKRDADRRASLDRVLSAAGRSPRAALEAAIEWQLTWVGDRRFRGCGFVRAAAELDAGGAIAAVHAREHKAWYQAELGRLAALAGVADSERLARRLALVMEGATTLGFVHGPTAVVDEARQLSRELIAAACADDV
jgi:AcrR family transcriptional regulator